MMDKRPYVLYQWRVGRSVGRTIYAVTGDNPNEHILIGLMDAPELARYAVIAHNDWLGLKYATEDSE